MPIVKFRWPQAKFLSPWSRRTPKYMLSSTHTYTHNDIFHHVHFNSMFMCVVPLQFHGDTPCSEAGPLATSPNIALTFS